jgi:hypothetical protein
MNYKKIYDELISKRLNNTLEKNEYGEYHHIIPKCMGGSDENSNIVKLSAKEHYIAHHLLYKIYKTPSMAHAWFCMTRNSEGQNRAISAIQYESARKAHIEALKQTMVGKGNHFYGKQHTEEAKQKISKANSGRKKTQKEIDNWVEKVAKKSKSNDHRKKIGRKDMIILKNIHTNESIRIHKSNLHNYDESVWVNPTKLARGGKRDKCKYCGFESVAGMIKRHHNENCKFKETGVYQTREEIYLQKRTTNKKQIPVEINGHTYKSINSAARALGVSKYEIKKLAGI